MTVRTKNYWESVKFRESRWTDILTLYCTTTYYYVLFHWRCMHVWYVLLNSTYLLTYLKCSFGFGFTVVGRVSRFHPIGSRGLGEWSPGYRRSVGESWADQPDADSQSARCLSPSASPSASAPPTESTTNLLQYCKNKVKWVRYRYSSLLLISPLRELTCTMGSDHTVLPATRQKWRSRKGRMAAVPSRISLRVSAAGNSRHAQVLTAEPPKSAPTGEGNHPPV